jgi:hypothetical protein
MIISRWATGCQSTSIPVSFASPVCIPNNTPSAPPLPGNTLFFTSPNPPGPNQQNPNSGGVNGNWMAYYGFADGTCDLSCSFGNINSISDLRRGSTYATAPAIDCYNTAIGDVYVDGTTNADASSTRVCYLPSSARLGIDNDNIIITSSVYNDNVPLSARVLRNTGNGNSDPTNIPFAGTRLRVHKKAGFYSFTQLSSIAAAGAAIGTGETCAFNSPKMCPGSAQPSSGTPLQGDFYDLWDIRETGQPVYTFDRNILPNQAIPGGSNRVVPGPNYEPDHVRGRSLATYNGNANLDDAFSTIWGTVNQGFTGTTATNPPQTLIYHRVIRYTRQPQGTLVANGQSIPATVDLPKIQGGIPDLWPRQQHEVPQFQNPNTVTQRTMLSGAATPYLYVGDDRPHRVISREGHRYIARVAATPSFTGFSGLANESTVVYDIVQKLTIGTTAAQTVAGEVYNTQWSNGNFYAPMFDTPANVVQYGSISPVNALPFLEKLFVGTTYPALAPTDTRLQNYGNLSQTSLLACTGQEPSVNSNGRAFPGLWDMRCGEDAYDRRTDLRHPISAAFTYGDFEVRLQPAAFGSDAQRSFLVPFGLRGGASTDVNNMGLWTYGAYAKGRLGSLSGPGQFGTYVAHYPLTFPIRDPYNNLISSYADVPPGHVFYPFVQIAKQTEISPGSRLAGPTENFNPNDLVVRGQMAQWLVRAQMDEGAITQYLISTGGAFCSFGDACGINVGTDITNVTLTGAAPNYWRYVETMYRRGYTKGCADTNAGQRRFCPTDNLTRGEMAVFIVRAKANSVFPTVTSGAFTTITCQPTGTTVANVGDQFGLFIGCNGYFADVPNNHIYYAFIQKLREWRITNGTDLTNRCYSPGGTSAAAACPSSSGTLTKGQLMTFLVRAFFP